MVAICVGRAVAVAVPVPEGGRALGEAVALGVAVAGNSGVLVKRRVAVGGSVAPCAMVGVAVRVGVGVAVRVAVEVAVRDGVAVSVAVGVVSTPATTLRIKLVSRLMLPFFSISSSR
jgi:hypothetical protein